MLRKVLVLILSIIILNYTACATILMKVTAGYRNSIINGEYFPVRVELTSYDEKFSGYILVENGQIYSPVNYDKYKKNITLYGERNKKIVYLYCSIPYHSLTVRLYDNNDNIRAEAIPKNMVDLKRTDYPQFLSISGYNNYDNRFILIVDNKDRSISIDPFVIQRQRSNYSGRPTKRNNNLRTITISPEELPDHQLGYRMADCVIFRGITQNEFKKYVSKSGILNWVKLGGNLLIMPDKEYQSYNKAFLSEIIPVEFTGYNNIKLNSTLTKFFKSKMILNSVYPAVTVKTMKNSNIPAEEQLVTTDKNVIYGKYKIGLGNIFLFALNIDNPDISMFLKTSAIFWTDKMRKTLFHDYRHGIFDSISRIFHQYYNIKLPRLITIFLFLLFFLVIVAPFNFLILKKLKKEILLWITIPVISILFAFFGYLWSLSYASKSLYKYNLSISAMNSGDKEKYVIQFTNIFSPFKQKLSLTARPGFSLEAYPSARKKRRLLYNQADVLSINDVNSGAKEYSSFYSEGIEKSEGTVRASLGPEIYPEKKSASSKKIFKRKVYIRNASGEDLTEAFILYKNHLFFIGQIRAGKEVNKFINAIDINNDRSYTSLFPYYKSYYDFNNLSKEYLIYHQRNTFIACLFANTISNITRDHIASSSRNNFYIIRNFNFNGILPVDFNKPVLCAWLKSPEDYIELKKESKGITLNNSVIIVTAGLKSIK